MTILHLFIQIMNYYISYIDEGVIMTPRENLLKLLRRENHETIPVEMDFCPTIKELYKKETGSDLPYHEYFDFPERSVAEIKLPASASEDWTRFYPEELAPGTTFDTWGVAHEPGSEEAKHMTRMHHPLKGASFDEIKAYPFPRWDLASDSHMKKQADKIKESGYAAAGYQACTIWETSWYIRSMEDLMMDMAMEDEKAVWLLDKITDDSCIRAAAFARAGVDILHLGDDVGMQFNTMLSTDMWRQWLKPRLKRVIDAARAEKPDILIFYHSCGFVIPFIEDFIEIGIDILNPAQPECMDFADLFKQFGGRISFWGAIGTQTTMPFGTLEEVRNEVEKDLKIAGPRGGFFPAPTHLLEPEVPWENIMAYVQACRDWKW
jgi:uroporphyrinogen decarboxylase